MSGVSLRQKVPDDHSTHMSFEAVFVNEEAHGTAGYVEHARKGGRSGEKREKRKKRTEREEWEKWEEEGDEEREREETETRTR